MSTSTGTWQEGSGEPATESPLGSVPNGHAYNPEAPLLGTVADACSNCGAAMAVDQRYCVECGERRGQPRFAFAPEAATDASEAPEPQRRRRSGAPGVMTVIAGLATLLLALGVGVLIGTSVDTTPQAVRVTVNTGGGSASGSSSSAGAGSSSAQASGSSSSHSGGSTGGTHTGNHSSGSGASGNATQQQGTSCTAGTPGCVNGKQTGNLFGGG
jgi:hypothetical protein